MITISYLISIILGRSGPIHNLVVNYGYTGIGILMMLESASLPIPSEVILPLSGQYIHLGILNFPGVLLVALLGGLVGFSIDYFIAYFLGKDVIYNHLHIFHLKKESVENFETWFEKNGSFAVFIIRMVPGVRGLISLVAGFAKMDLKKFYLFSFLGSLVWDTLLIIFGYYAFSGSLTSIIEYVAILLLVLYLIYVLLMRNVKKTVSKEKRAGNSTKDDPKENESKQIQNH
ncbi:MAG: DedA family protein [Thermoplasmataceae archaeon]|jgi:membrane protein DedA with SNARE-associated domain